jgi:hypothetical protein
MKTNKFKIILTVFIFSLFIYNTVFALPSLKNANEQTTTFATKSGFKPVDTTTSIDTVIGDIIKYFLSFLGVIFLGLLIYGGFTWMRARGDDGAVTIAKETMINAITGLIIVLGSYAATAWVISNLTESTLK